MTQEFILVKIFWMIFIQMMKAAEEFSDVFENISVSRYNLEFARDLIIKKELSKFL